VTYTIGNPNRRDCEQCGRLNSGHTWLNFREYRSQSEYHCLTMEDSSAFWTFVPKEPAPDDPCDIEHMLEISS
jgi:hypothetical protein